MRHKLDKEAGNRSCSAHAAGTHAHGQQRTVPDLKSSRLETGTAMGAMPGYPHDGILLISRISQRF
jgi:hypothetical protein